MDTTPRVTWKDHEGRRYLHADMRDLDRDGQLRMLADYADAVRGKAPGSVRLLALGNEIEFFPEVMTQARAVFLENQACILRSAHVGLTGITKVAFENYFQSAAMLGQRSDGLGRQFDAGAMDQALEWLFKD